LEFRISSFDFRFSSFDFLPAGCNISRSIIENGPRSNESSLPPSKRAARRLIQRALVLTGRDKQLRQHLREARLTTLWILEDWDLVWTVIIDRGKIEFERRPAKHPDLTLTWQTANEFFSYASRSFRGVVGQRATHRNKSQDVTPAKARVHVQEELDSRVRGNDVAFDGAKRRISHGPCFQGEIPRGVYPEQTGETFRRAQDDSERARNASESASPEGTLELAGNIELRRAASHLLNSFLNHLGHVLRNPVNGAGESLL
jgi:hypothetical protein